MSFCASIFERTSIYALCLSLCLTTAVACGDDDLDDIGDDNNQDIIEDKQTDTDFAPPALVLTPFTINVEADTTLTTTGHPVTLRALPGNNAPEGDLSFAWAFEGSPEIDAESPDAPVQTLTFTEPGLFIIDVLATDEAGNTVDAGALIIVEPEGADSAVGDVNGDGAVNQDDVQAALGRLSPGATLSPAAFERADVDLDGTLSLDDIDLIEQAASEGALAPRHLDPVRGSFGRLVTLIHPALLDPKALALIAFGDLDPIAPMRGRPGYATFLVPVGLDTGATALKLIIDGGIADQLDFEILDAPQPSDEPGEQVIEALQRLERVTSAMPALIGELLTALDATPDERALLQGLSQLTANSMPAHVEAFAEAFGQMEPEARAVYEQIALANGLDEALTNLDDIQSDLRALSFASAALGVAPDAAQRLIDVICTARKIAEVSNQIAEINDIVSDAIDFLGFLTFVPGAGALIKGIQAITASISVITDAIAIVADFIPSFGDLVVTADPNRLNINQSSIVLASMRLNILRDLCDKGAAGAIEDIIGQIRDSLVRGISRRIPGVGAAFRRARFQRDNLGFLTGLAFDAISFIADKIIDASGVQSLLEDLAEKICDAIGDADPDLLFPDQVLSYSCGGNGGTFTCTEACVGTVTVTARTEVCDEEKVATTTIECLPNADEPDDDDDDEDKGQCSCGDDDALLEVVEGCEGFDDATQCSGWHSVFCFNDSADPNDPLCTFEDASTEAFESTDFSSGTAFTAFDCTIRIRCN